MRQIKHLLYLSDKILNYIIVQIYKTTYLQKQINKNQSPTKSYNKQLL